MRMSRAWAGSLTSAAGNLPVSFLYDGLIQGIRLADCPADCITIVPKALDPNSDYQLETAESGEKCLMRGSALLDGSFTFELPWRSGAIWFYSRA